MKRLLLWRTCNKNKNNIVNHDDLSSWEIINPSDDDRQTLFLSDDERPMFSEKDVQNESVEVDNQKHDEDELPRFIEEEDNTKNDHEDEQLPGFVRPEVDLFGNTIEGPPVLFFTELDKPFRLDPSVFDPYKFPACVCDYSRKVSDQVNALDETDERLRSTDGDVCDLINGLDETDKPLRSTEDDAGDQVNGLDETNKSLRLINDDVCDQVNGLDETDKPLTSTDDMESVYNHDDDDDDDVEYDYYEDDNWFGKQRMMKVGKKVNYGMMKKSKKMPRYYYNKMV